MRHQYVEQPDQRPIPNHQDKSDNRQRHRRMDHENCERHRGQRQPLRDHEQRLPTTRSGSPGGRRQHPCARQPDPRSGPGRPGLSLQRHMDRRPPNHQQHRVGNVQRRGERDLHHERHSHLVLYQPKHNTDPREHPLRQLDTLPPALPRELDHNPGRRRQYKHPNPEPHNRCVERNLVHEGAGRLEWDRPLQTHRRELQRKRHRTLLLRLQLHGVHLAHQPHPPAPPKPYMGSRRPTPLGLPLRLRQPLGKRRHHAELQHHGQLDQLPQTLVGHRDIRLHSRRIHREDEQQQDQVPGTRPTRRRPLARPTRRRPTLQAAPRRIYKPHMDDQGNMVRIHRRPRTRRLPLDTHPQQPLPRQEVLLHHMARTRRRELVRHRPLHNPQRTNRIRGELRHRKLHDQRHPLARPPRPRYGAVGLAD